MKPSRRRGDFQGLDVAVDFSIPSAVPENVEKFGSLGVNMVIGTTGWHDRFEEVKSAAERHGIGVGLESRISPLA